MRTLLPATIALTLAMATSAFAQTSTTQPPTTSSPPTATQPATPPAGSTTSPMNAPMMKDSVTLTEAESKAWIDKAVYSSDGKNIGEVAAFAHDGSGKVTELHADIGGFLGLGETRVRLTPSEFKLEGDRVVLNVTSEMAKSLPKVAKK